MIFYQDDFVTIYNKSGVGECQNYDAIVVTDPPYNIGYGYSDYSDTMEENEYYEMLKNSLGNKFVCIHYFEQLFKLSAHIEQIPTKVVPWVYPSNTPRQCRGVGFFNVKPDFKLAGQPYKNPNDKRIKLRIEQGKQSKLYDWWEVNQVKNVSKEKTEHPCQIPLKVMDNIIKIIKPDLVIDPFMGSGTTLLACKNNGVKCIGFEIDTKYCEIAAQRMLKPAPKKEE